MKNIQKKKAKELADKEKNDNLVEEIEIEYWVYVIAR